MRNSQNTKPNITGFVAIILFVGLATYLAIVVGIRKRTEEELQSEKLKSEFLLSEKLSEQKINTSLHENLKEATEQNKIVSNDLQATRTLLAQKDVELRLSKSAVHKNLIREQKAALKYLRQRIHADSIAYTEEFAQLKSQVSLLESRIADKNVENQKLIDEIERLRLLSMDNVGTETLKKNKKLTTKASKARTITAKLDISAQAENLHYEIIDPAGKLLSTSNSNSSLTVTNSGNAKTSNAFFVSPELRLKSTEPRSTVTITYVSSQKLLAGVYKIVLFSGEEPIGNLMLRLE